MGSLQVRLSKGLPTTAGRACLLLVCPARCLRVCRFAPETSSCWSVRWVRACREPREEAANQVVSEFSQSTLTAKAIHWVLPSCGFTSSLSTAWHRRLDKKLLGHAITKVQVLLFCLPAGTLLRTRAVARWCPMRCRFLLAGEARKRMLAPAGARAEGD